MELFTSFEGRISRKSFWIGVLGIVAASVVSLIILQQLFGLPGRQLVYVSMAVSFILLWPMAAVCTKRLHDRDKPAMPWLFIFFGAAFAGNIMRSFEIDYSIITLAEQQVLYPGRIAVVVSLFGLVTGVWALIELGMLKGSRDENSYGPVPLT